RQLRHRFDGEIAPHVNAEERKIFLGPCPIKFDVVRLADFARADIADHTDDFSRHTGAADKQRLADRILTAKKLLRAALANQDYLRTIGGVVFVETASGQKRNSPRLQIIRRDIMAGGGGALIDREDFAVRPGVKHVAAGAGEKGNVGAQARALQTGDITQSGERLFGEALARAEIGIARIRQGDEAEPNIVRAIADILLAQAHETGDEQGRAREQRHGKGNLRADENFAET